MPIRVVQLEPQENAVKGSASAPFPATSWRFEEGLWPSSIISILAA